VIAVSSSGKSFRALAAYLAAGRTGEERDRVAWSAARNLPTNDPELAATFMRATAAQSAKVEKPVYHVVLSFDPTDVPDRAMMEKVADKVLHRLGLAEHQTIIVAHRDPTHAHLHLLVKRVHNQLGRAWERWKDQPVVQQVLREQESALGLRRVESSLTLALDGTDQARTPLGSGRHEVHAEPGPQLPTRECESSRALNEIGDGLGQYERASSLKEELRETRSDLDAAQARVTRLELAHARAHAAVERFESLLTAVYRDSESAGRAFTKLAEQAGIAEAVRIMTQYPERLGLVRTTERRVLGVRTAESDHDARRHSPAAARAGQEAIACEREMWTAASEARMRRLDETFAHQLRSLFVDEKAAAAVFTQLATRDGIDAAANTLRTSPSGLGELRSSVSNEPNARQSLLDRAAAAGAEVVRQRGFATQVTEHLSPGVSRPRELAMAELTATRERVAGLVEGERAARESLARLPRRVDLEHSIARAADRLLPRELRKLETMLTAPRLALLARIRSTVRDALLARDERSA
jgi:hypothetical protein